jgi:tetratricopeptide (TPR) repeat protein
MASVYLYHLDKPKQAIETIETYCADSPLDTSMIHYDAYERLGDLNSCIKVIESCVPKIDNEYHKAVLYYKAGLLEERKGKSEDAIPWHKKAIDLAPTLLEPYERLCGIYSKSESWVTLQDTLKKFSRVLQNKELIYNIEELEKRISKALGANGDG